MDRGDARDQRSGFCQGLAVRAGRARPGPMSDPVRDYERRAKLAAIQHMRARIGAEEERLESLREELEAAEDALALFEDDGNDD